jgi:hypothetical protein
VKIGFHGVHLMSDELDIIPGVAFVGIDPVDAGIRRNMASTLGKGEPHSRQRAKAVLFLQQQGQEGNINVVGEFVLPSAEFGTPRNVAEMVLDATGMVTNFLVP